MAGRARSGWSTEEKNEFIEKLSNIAARLDAQEKDSKDRVDHLYIVVDKLSQSLANFGEKSEAAYKILANDTQSSIKALADETRNSIKSVNDRLNEKAITNWPVLLASIGLGITILGGIGVYALTKEVGPVQAVAQDAKSVASEKLDKADLPLYIRPLDESLTRTIETVQRMDNRFMAREDIQADLAAIRDRLRFLETQKMQGK